MRRVEIHKQQLKNSEVLTNKELVDFGLVLGCFYHSPLEKIGNLSRTDIHPLKKIKTAERDMFIVGDRGKSICLPELATNAGLAEH